jgi:diadenosine tetraphosphate (Ap4A) HIT family hydrolase
MPTLIHRRVAAAQDGKNLTVICRVPSGWAVLSDTQFLRGYSLLLPDPVVPDLNFLKKNRRMQFLYDMTIIGDALIEVTDAYRINYEILGNLEPALHAHIIPRYRTEPEERRKAPPFFYPAEVQNSNPFNLERDQELMKKLAAAILKRFA